MSQYARPDSDTYIGVWTTSPLWSKVDEGSTGDSVRVHSDANPLNSEPFVVHLSSVDDPVSSTGHILRARWEETLIGVANIEFQAELRLGYSTETAQGTLIGSLNVVIANEQTPQTDTYTLSTTECDAISDYTSLYMRTWCAKSGGGATPNGAVDFLELEVPDAGAAPVTVTLNEGTLTATGVASDPVPGARSLGLSEGTLSATGVQATVSAVSGVIIEIDHEEGDLTDYTSTVNPDGDELVIVQPGLGGTGDLLEVLIDDDDALYGEYALAEADTSGVVRVRFYIDPNSIQMANEDRFDILHLRNSTPAYIYGVALQFTDANGYALRFAIVDDTATENFTSFLVLPAANDGPHYIEFVLVRSGDGDSDGYTTVWIDGVEKETVDEIDNYDRFDDFKTIRVGMVWGRDAGTSGSIYLDEIIVNNTGNEIGPTSEGVSISLSEGSISFTGESFDIIPGARSLALSEGTFAFTGVQLSVSAPPPPVSVSLSEGSLSLAGVVGALIPGAVAKTLSEGSLTFTGPALDVVPGLRSLSMSEGALAFSGETLSLILGAVTKVLSEGSLSFSGQILDIVPGLISIDLNNGTLTIAGVQLSVVAGAPPLTISLSEGSATISGVAGDIIPGAFSLGLSEATLTFTGQTLTVSTGVISITLSEGTLTFSGQTLSISVGALFVDLSEGIITFTGETLSPAPGAVTIITSEGTVTFTGIQLTVSAGVVPKTVILSEGAATFAGVTADIVPGSVSISMGEGTLTISGVQLTLVAGEASITLAESSITFTGISGDVIPGSMAKALSEGALTFTGVPADLVPGLFTLPLSEGSMALAGVGSDIIPGEFALALAEANLQFTGDTITVQWIGPQTIALGSGALVFTGESLLPALLSYIYLTLVSRGVALTVDDRDVGLSLDDREVTLTVEAILEDG